MTTVKQVADAAFAAADGVSKMTDTLRAYMAGVPAAKRDEKIKMVYELLREVDGKTVKTVELPDRHRRAYDACRQAFRRLFPKGNSGRRKTKSGKVTVTKVTGIAKQQIAGIVTKPKKLQDVLKSCVAQLQAQEKPQYKDVPGLIAALQIAIDLAV